MTQVQRKNGCAGGIGVGITITGKYEGAPSYDMGASSFFRLRRDIAYTVSEEYGKHYERMPEACAKLLDVGIYDLRTERLIKKYHCKERMLDFLYQSDVDGKLSPFKCKALYDQIVNMESKTLYGYAAYPQDCMTIDNFKDLLKECYDRRVYLVWY